MEIVQVEERDAVRSVVAAVEAAANLGRTDDVAALFADGAVLLEDGRVLRGRGAIRAELERRRGRPRVAGSPSGPGTVIRQLTSTQVALVSPTEAHCSSRFVATSVTGVDHSGHYADVLRRIDGRWLIAQRQVRIDAAVTRSAVRGGVRRQGGHLARPPVAGPSVVARRVRATQ